MIALDLPWLHVAVNTEGKAMLVLLLSAPRPEHQLNVDIKDKRGNTALHSAVLSGNNSIVALLLMVKPNIEVLGSDNRTALHMAVLQQDEDILQCLLEHGAKIEQDLPRSQTLLHGAAIFGSVKAAKVLLEHDTAKILLYVVDEQNKTVLNITREKEKHRMVKKLMQVDKGLTYPKPSPI